MGAGKGGGKGGGGAVGGGTVGGAASGDTGGGAAVGAAAVVTFRPIAEADLPFLYRLYASTREEELARVDWPPERKEAFLRFQFEAQHRHYMEHYAGARFDLVLVDGEPAGRLYVADWRTEVRLIDIALAPERRNRGLGTRLLRDLQAAAAATGKPLTIHVERFNPALALYERLGFARLEENGPYFLMEWRAERAGGIDPV
jgi:ribosomal protein S18 acetylase RimI-like enzyme